MNYVNTHLIIKPAAQKSDGLILLRSDNPSSRRYQLILVLRHIGNRQLLNGADIPLHVIEVDVVIRCDGEANFDSFQFVPSCHVVIGKQLRQLGQYPDDIHSNVPIPDNIARQREHMVMRRHFVLEISVISITPEVNCNSICRKYPCRSVSSSLDATILHATVYEELAFPIDVLLLQVHIASGRCEQRSQCELLKPYLPIPEISFRSVCFVRCGFRRERESISLSSSVSS